MKGNGSRLDGKSSADEIVTVYSLEDWNVLYNGVRKNMPQDLLRCLLATEGIATRTPNHCLKASGCLYRRRVRILIAGRFGQRR